MPKRVEDSEMRRKAGLGLEMWTRWVRRDLERSLKAEGFTTDQYSVSFEHEETSVVVHHVKSGFMITWTNPDSSDRVRETVRFPREVEVPFIVDMARGLVHVCRERVGVSDG